MPIISNDGRLTALLRLIFITMGTISRNTDKLRVDTYSLEFEVWYMPRDNARFAAAISARIRRFTAASCAYGCAGFLNTLHEIRRAFYDDDFYEPEAFLFHDKSLPATRHALI